MKSFLYFISLVASLLWVLVKDIPQYGTTYVSIVRNVPIVILFLFYCKKDRLFYLPVLFFLFLLAIRIFGPYAYDFSGMLTMAATPIALYVFSHLTISHPQIIATRWLIFSTLVLYAILYSTTYHINPNQIGFIYLILFYVIIASYDDEGGKRTRMTVSSLLFLAVFALVFQTDSRNSIVVYFLLLAAFLFGRRLNKYLLLSVYVVLALYIAYPWVYDIYSRDFNMRATQNTEMLGQDIFSGRHIIWEYIFNRLGEPKHFWFGGINTEWWGKSMHNSAMDVVVRYGIPALLFLFYVIIRFFNWFARIFQGHGRMMLFFMVVMMVWGWNESGLFLGSSYLLFLPLCMHSKAGPVETK